MSAGAVGSADVVSGAFPVWASAAAAFPGERVSAPSLRGPELVGGGGCSKQEGLPVLALGALFWVAVLGQGSGSLRLAVTFGRLSGVGGGLGRCCAWCFLDIKYVVGG